MCNSPQCDCSSSPSCSSKKLLETIPVTPQQPHADVALQSGCSGGLASSVLSDFLEALDEYDYEAAADTFASDSQLYLQNRPTLSHSGLAGLFQGFKESFLDPFDLHVGYFLQDKDHDGSLGFLWFDSVILDSDDIWLSHAIEMAIAKCENDRWVVTRDLEVKETCDAICAQC